MTSHLCPSRSTRVALTQDEVRRREVVCLTCGRSLKIKPSAFLLEATLPRHKGPTPVLVVDGGGA